MPPLPYSDRFNFLLSATLTDKQGYQFTLLGVEMIILYHFPLMVAMLAQPMKFRFRFFEGNYFRHTPPYSNAARGVTIGDSLKYLRGQQGAV